jgi:hypothetical protein
MEFGKVAEREVSGFRFAPYDPLRVFARNSFVCCQIFLAKAERESKAAKKT